MHFWFLIALVINTFSGWASLQQQLDLIRVLSPNDGNVLQGVVTIKGTIAGVGLQSSEVGFRYQEGGSETWFFIDQINEPVVDEIIAQWDTATIADGTYQLRVIANYADGHQLESIVNNLRVRNYTAIETPIYSTEESASLILPVASATLLPTKTVLVSTPTPVAANEMVLTTDDLVSSVIQGAVIGILFLLAIGIWIFIRRGRLGY